MSNRIYKPNGAYTEYRGGHNPLDGTPRYIDIVMPTPEYNGYAGYGPVDQSIANAPSMYQTARQQAGQMARSEDAWQGVQDALIAKRRLMTQPGGFLMPNDRNANTSIFIQAGRALAGRPEPVMDFPVNTSMMMRGY